MSSIQDFFTDLLNGFAVDQIPLFLFQLLCAALAGHILQIIVNKKLGESLLQYSALIASSAALMASLVKMTEPLAILGAAVLLLLLRRKEKGNLETLGTLIVVLIGVGCGVGSVIQTGIGCIVLFGIVLFTPLKK